jgi:hypothetical protein
MRIAAGRQRGRQLRLLDLPGPSFSGSRVARRGAGAGLRLSSCASLEVVTEPTAAAAPSRFTRGFREAGLRDGRVLHIKDLVSNGSD